MNGAPKQVEKVATVPETPRSVPAVFAVLFVGLIGATCLYGLGLPVS